MYVYTRIYSRAGIYFIVAAVCFIYIFSLRNAAIFSITS